MDSPQVQLSGSKDPDSSVNSNTNEVEMEGTQDSANDSMNPESTALAGQTEATTAMEDGTLPDAQPDPEPTTPAKKSAGFKFLE